MMKAQLDDTSDPPTLRVCGRLADRWVDELERYWQTARANHPAQPLAIDLRSVTFIDHSGEALLRRMHAEGARFLTAGLWNRELVDQITGGAR
jgi:anti-anti-sigma regulatory factor